MSSIGMGSCATWKRICWNENWAAANLWLLAGKAKYICMWIAAYFWTKTKLCKFSQDFPFHKRWGWAPPRALSCRICQNIVYIISFMQVISNMFIFNISSRGVGSSGSLCKSGWDFPFYIIYCILYLNIFRNTYF